LITEPRIHTFGGPLSLNSMGRNGVPAGELGALRYDPGNGDNRAVVTNPIAVTGLSDLHVEGSGNQLELSGPLSGTASWVKSGGGALKLSGDSSAYLAQVQVDSGSVELAGRIGSPLSLAASGTLRGHGRSGGLSGSGTVELKDTVLHAASVAWLNGRFVATWLPHFLPSF
jgi:autotransporter-associated beta strand protein